MKPRINPALQSVLVAAASEATMRRHRHITLEHVLLAMTREPTSKAMLAGLGVDVAELERDLRDYVELLEEHPKGRAHASEPDGAYAEVMVALAHFGQPGGKPQIEAGDVLVALSLREDAYAAILLRAAGVEPIDVLRYVSHGAVRFDLEAPANAPTLRVVMHNDHFTTMEFVVQMLREVFGLTLAEATARMLEVHRAGSSEIGRWRAPRARAMVKRVTEQAEAEGYPLRCTLLP